MTILTDDERPKLPFSPYLFTEWRSETERVSSTMYTAEQMEAYAEAIEAAVLAKLREQEPVAWTLTETLSKRETTTNAYLWFSNPVNSSWTPLYAAPLPAVVQVPQDAIDALEAVKAKHWTHWSGHDLSEFNIAISKLRRAAAPEAPAQAIPTKLPIPPAGADALDVVYAEGWNAACDAFFGGKPAPEPTVITVEAQAIPAPWREAMKVARRALVEAEEAVADWGSYASEHFQNKHDLDGDLRRIRAALAQLDALEGGE